MFTDSFQEQKKKLEEADSRKAADRLKTTMVYNNARAETKMERVTVCMPTDNHVLSGD